MIKTEQYLEKINSYAHDFFKLGTTLPISVIVTPKSEKIY